MVSLRIIANARSQYALLSTEQNVSFYVSCMQFKKLDKRNSVSFHRRSMCFKLENGYHSAQDNTWK